MRAPAGYDSSQLLPLIPSALPSSGGCRRKSRSFPLLTGISGFSVVPCQCNLGPWGSAKKRSPPIPEQVRVCLITPFSTLPNHSRPLHPSLPPFPSNSGHAKPFSRSVHVCRGSSEQGGLEEAVGLHLQVPSSLRVQTAFFFFSLSTSKITSFLQLHYNQLNPL